METNFTILAGLDKGSKHYCRKLLSFLSLLLLITTSTLANNLLEVSVSSTDVTCPGANDGTATATPFDGWAPFTYEWSNGETTSTITGLAPGLYEVTVVDVDGAIAVGETYIEEDAMELSLNASYETCVGSGDANASVNVSGGIPPYSYLWSTGETFVVAMNLSAGIYTVTVTDANGCTEEGSIEVELSPEGVWIMTSSTDANCGLENGTAHVTVMTGTAPFIIEWSNGDMGEDIDGLAPGTYTVTVTDANGCSNTGEVEIETDSDLSVDITGTDADCGQTNGTATATVNGGTPPFSYLWNTGETTAMISGLGAGTYSVTVTDDTGCSNIKSISIDQESDIDTDTFHTNADCGQNNGSATAFVNGGTPPYSFIWSTGSTDATIDNLAPGVYSVTASDANGCSDSETVLVEGEDPDGGVINTSDNLEVCAGDGIDDFVDVVLSGNEGQNSIWVITNPNNDIIGFSSGPPFNFEGAGAGTCVIWHLSYDDGLTGLEIGNNISDLVGCFNFSNSIVVVRADPEGGMLTTNDNTNICVGDGLDDFIDVTLTGASGSNQSWIITDGSGNILGLPGNPPFNFEGAGPGNCQIWSISYEPGIIGLEQGTNIADLEGCYELSSNFINVIRNEGPSIMLTATDVTCNGEADGSISSNVSGGDGNYTYEWSNGVTTSDIDGLEAGDYTLTVTDGNGCSATATATISEPVLLTISASGTDETCTGSNDGSITTNTSGGTMPYSYLWSSGQTTADISGLAPGVYTVTVTDANGCTAVSNDITISSNGITSCSAMVTSSYNEGVDISTFGGSDGSASADATGGTQPYSFEWSTGQTTSSINGLSAGTYTVTVSDANDCTCTSEITLNDPSKVGDFVWEDENEDGIQDVGEPGINNVTVNLEGVSDAGVNVNRTVNTNPNGSYSFDGLPAGNYKITFSQPGGFSVSPQDEGSDDEKDSDVNAATGMTDNFDLASSVCDNSYDAGYFRCVNIGDFVFYDGNRDGIQQPWEAGYSDAYVKLMSAGPDGVFCNSDDVIEQAEVTGPGGLYLFECVDPGTYYIEFDIPTATYMFTGQNLGGDDELDSDPDPNTGKTDLFTVIENMPDDLSFDAGVYLICDDFNTGGSIGYDQEICPGEFPDPLVSISLPGGGYGNAEYLWLKSTTGGPIGSGAWMEIPNSDSPTYAPPQLYQTTYYIRCARRENCDEFIAESNVVVIVVNTCFGQINNLKADIINNSDVMIEWTTNPENELYRYHVERSNDDGNSYDVIGMINGLGDQQTTNHYHFMDETPRVGRNMYRITRVNLFSGFNIQSNIVEVVFTLDENRFFVYPNPVINELTIESIHTMNGNSILELYDASGKKLDTVEVDYTVGKASFNLERYPSGAYLIKVKYADKDKTDVIKVIKE